VQITRPRPLGGGIKFLGNYARKDDAGRAFDRALIHRELHRARNIGQDYNFSNLNFNVEEYGEFKVLAGEASRIMLPGLRGLLHSTHPGFRAAIVCVCEVTSRTSLDLTRDWSRQTQVPQAISNT
jgi:hypothetical protein